MKPREASILLLVLVLGLAAVVTFGFGGDEDAPPPAGEPEQGIPAGVPVAPSRTGSNEPDRNPIPEPIDPVTGANDTRPTRELPPDAEAGVIDGELIVRGDLLDVIPDYTILVNELLHDPTGQQRGEHFRRVFRINPDGLQLFAIENVPFSNRGYRVEIFADGMNGSSTIVSVTQQAPVAEAVLTLMQAGPFTVRLTDQYNNALEGKQVELRPTPPIGRRNVFSESDGYGSAVFPVLVAGDYEVWVDNTYRDTIAVIAELNGSNPTRAGAGSTLLQLPVGRSLQVELADRVNNPMAGITVQLRKIDTRDSRTTERTSDSLGHAVFEHLEPGPYRLEVRGESIRPTFRRIDVLEPDETAQEMQQIQIRVNPR